MSQTTLVVLEDFYRAGTHTFEASNTKRSRRDIRITPENVGSYDGVFSEPNFDPEGRL